MRALGVAVVLSAFASLRAQSASVEDLFAHDWQARNRAAAALVQAATVDEAALVAAMRREDVPPMPNWNDAVGLGGGIVEEDPVRDLLWKHRRQQPGRSGPFSVRIPQSTKDLVVPFDTRLLAAFVLHARDTQSLLYAEALLELVARKDDSEVWVSAASYAWRLRGEESVLRTMAIGESRVAERLASCAAEAGEVALREVLFGLRTGSGPVRTAILDRLDSRWVAAQPELAALALELLGSEVAEVADAAAALAQSAGLFARPEFAAALLDRKRAARATFVLLDEQKAPTALATPLVHLLLDAKMPVEARERAAFVLKDLGPSLERDHPELARAAFEALATLYADPKVSGDLGLAVIAALGGYAKSMTPECEQRLAKHANAWISRISGGQFAALGALLDSKRVDAMPLEVLAGHWKEHRRDGLADRLVGALLRRGGESGTVLRADARLLARTYFVTTSDLVPFAPTLRQWLDDEEVDVRAFAARMLSRLGADSGLDEDALLLLCRGGGAAAGGGAATERERDERRRLLGPIATTEASFDWFAANWGDDMPAAQTLARIATAPFPIERRITWLRPLLAHARAEDWPVQNLEPETLRQLARTVHADTQGRSAALAVLAKLGPLAPEDEALFLAELTGDGAGRALNALAAAATLPSGLRAAVEGLCEDEGEWSNALSATNLLWATRPR